MAFAGLSGPGRRGGMAMTNFNFHDEFDGKASCGCFNPPKPKEPKRLTKIGLLKERIRQFSIWYFEEQDQLDKDLFMRRVERHKQKIRHVHTKKIYFMRFIYILDVFVWLSGSVFLLCSSIDSFGQYTPFYESQILYRIIGVLLLLLAVLLLLFVTGFKHKTRKTHNKRRGKFYILKKKERGTSMKSGGVTEDVDKDISEDSGNEEDIDAKTVQKPIHKTQQKDDSKGFTPSSQPQPLQYYKNVESRQNSFELSPIASTSGRSAIEKSGTEINEQSARWNDARVAWTKSKWMRVESEDSIDNDTFHDTSAKRSLFGTQQSTDSEDLNERRGRFQMKSSNNTSSYDSDDLFHPACRSQSTKSKVSQASTISTCSETAPLVKR